MSRLLLIAALLLPACVSDEFEPTFEDSSAEPVEPDDQTEGFGEDTQPHDGPVEKVPADDDDDHDPPVEGDDDDMPEAPVDDGWDSAPPAGVTDGSLLHVDMTCALLDGLHTKTYRFESDQWVEVSGTGNGLFPEFLPCVGAARDRLLTWEGPDSMYILAGGMHHDLWPTETENHWLGEAYVDEGTSSQRCLDALDAAGLGWPVTMSLIVTSIEL